MGLSDAAKHGTSVMSCADCGIVRFLPIICIEDPESLFAFSPVNFFRRKRTLIIPQLDSLVGMGAANGGRLWLQMKKNQTEPVPR